jgi:hypothetical protein
MKDLDLGMWDFATVISTRKLNKALCKIPLGQVSSSQGKVSLNATISTFKLESPSDGAMKCSVLISQGTAEIKNGKKFRLDGVKVKFEIPLTEITPDGPVEDRHAALSFGHVGSGKGTGAGDLGVEDMQGVLPSPQLKLAVATLVVNALRDNPETEHIILARLVSKGVNQIHKPLGWHFYFDTDPSGEAFLCVLQAITMKPIDNEMLFPRKFHHEILPKGYDVATAFSRRAFWREVMVPAFSKSFGLKVASTTYKKTICSKWNGKLKDMRGDSYLANPSVSWSANFTLDFIFVAPQQVIFKFNVEMLLRAVFAITFDPISKKLSTRVVKEVFLPPQRDIIARIANAVASAALTVAAAAFTRVLPAIDVDEFAALNRWFVEWPHLEDVTYEAASLDGVFAPQFFGK